MLPTAVLAMLSLVAAVAPAARSPYEIGRFTNHSFTIYSVNVTSDGHVITSAGDDMVCCWNLETRQLEAEQEFDWVHRLRSAVSPDGNVVVSVDESSFVSIWLRNRPASLIEREDTQECILSVAFAPDRSYLATGDEDGSVVLWDASKICVGTSLSLSSDDKRRTLHTESEVESLEFSPDSKLLGTIGTKGNAFVCELWQVATGQRLQRFEVDGPTLAFSPDGKRFLAGKTLYDAATFQPITRLESFHPLHAAAFDPQGNWLGTAGDDNRIVLWDPHDGRKLAVVRAHDRAATCLAVTADGGRIITGSKDFSARIWDARRILAERPMDEPFSKLAASPHAFDVWRLGFTYSRGILMLEPQQSTNTALAEAAERAQTLGIETPAPPTEEQLKDRGTFLNAQLKQLAGQVGKRYDKTHASLFQLAGALPLLRTVYDPRDESMQKFGREVLSKIGPQMEQEFGALPAMFETFDERVTGKVEKKKMQAAFDALIREITLSLQAQQQALAGGKSADPR